MESQPPKPPEEPPEAPPAPQEKPAASAPAAAPPPAEPDPTQETAQEAAERPAPVPAQETAEEPGPAARRPRGRTSLIIASAALLGIVAGVATGYTIQADRKPTPLPPLSQAHLSYPAEHVPEDEWEPVPAKHDRRVKTDGDLRKLLVDKPKGAQDSKFYAVEDGWVPLSTYADGFESPGFMLNNVLGSDIRRVAARAWDSGRFKSSYVSLVQFRETAERNAPQYAATQQGYMPSEAGNDGHAMAGSGEGRYWVYDSPDREPGYLPLYTARAIACRGDIVMDIHIMDTGPISEKDIRELAERQLERL